jgi:hypothetical protein
MKSLSFFRFQNKASTSLCKSEFQVQHHRKCALINSAPGCDVQGPVEYRLASICTDFWQIKRPPQRMPWGLRRVIQCRFPCEASAWRQRLRRTARCRFLFLVILDRIEKVLKELIDDKRLETALLPECYAVKPLKQIVTNKKGRARMGLLLSFSPRDGLNV